MSWEPVAGQAATMWRHTGEPELWAGQSVLDARWRVEDQDGRIVAVVDTFQDVQAIAA